MKKIILSFLGVLAFQSLVFSQSSKDLKAIKFQKSATEQAKSDNVPMVQPIGVPNSNRTIFGNSERKSIDFIAPKSALQVLKNGWISGEVPILQRKKNSSLSAAGYEYLQAAASLMRIDAPMQELEITKTQATEGQQEATIRFRQTYQGLPVFDSEVLVHQKNGAIHLLNGKYFPTPKSIKNTIPTLTEKALSQKIATDLGKNNVAINSELGVFHQGKVPILAYQAIAEQDALHRWNYTIDANTGSILEKYNTVCSIFHDDLKDKLLLPNPELIANNLFNTVADGKTTATNNDSRGFSQTINTYLVGSTYYTIDASRPMYNAAQSSLPNNPVGAIITLDGRNSNSENLNPIIASSSNNSWASGVVSSHVNGGLAYEYFRSKFGRNSINGSGGNVFSIINVADDDGGGLDNAYWNGKAMFYGNGRDAFFPLVRGLDVAGHEMSHGVIQNTANLKYQNESGAINESFADVFGAMIDRDDWKIGEDVVRTSAFPSGALRDLQNPNNGGTSLQNAGYQPASVSQQYRGSEDNGGVHINSGITNRAYYLFATNANVGKEVAEVVYYRALTKYLVASSVFLDLRAAVEQSCKDLYPSNTNILTAAQNAFFTVGIGGAPSGGNTGGGGNPTPAAPADVATNPGLDYVLVSNNVSTSSPATQSLSIFNPFDPTQSTRISNTPHINKPSITDDGSVVVFIDADNNVRRLPVTYSGSTIGIGTEQTISALGTGWRSVAISRDGSKLALLKNVQEPFVYIYNFSSNSLHKFQLYNPTFTDSIATFDVQYADALEFDYTGESLIYDAYTENNSTNYWDIGFMKVWNNATNKAGSGRIEKLFSSLPDFAIVGNPTLSEKSPYIIAFDYVENFGKANAYYALAGANTFTGDAKVIIQNNYLAYPSYSKSDNYLLFDSQNGNDVNLNYQAITADKISAKAVVSETDSGSIRSTARWGIWFGNGKRKLPTTPTIDVQLNQHFVMRTYPNPLQEQLNIELNAAQSAIGKRASISIFDLTGRKVMQKESDVLQNGLNTLSVNSGDWQSGIYFIQANVAENVPISMKVVKM